MRKIQNFWNFTPKSIKFFKNKKVSDIFNEL